MEKFPIEKVQEEHEKTEKIVDALGYGIDDGIKETVTAFNISGLPTSSSCEGHLNRGLLLPWVKVSAPSEPKDRFVVGEDTISRIAKKYDIPEEDVRRANNKNAWIELRDELSNKDETKEYIDWREKNKKLINRANTFLTDFYKEHKAIDGIRLVVSENSEGDFHIHSKSEYAVMPISEKVFSSEEKRGHLEIQELARKEMNLFTEFLRKQYINKHDK